MEGLSERMGSRQLSEWMAYYRLDPFGEYRADVRSAIIATTIANANRGKDQPEFTIEDFMPRFEAKAEQSVEEMIQFAAMFTAALGGKDLRGGGNAEEDGDEHTAEIAAGAGG